MLAPHFHRGCLLVARVALGEEGAAFCRFVTEIGSCVVAHCRRQLRIKGGDIARRQRRAKKHDDC